MCGIAGLLRTELLSSEASAESAVARMTERLAHRGPDGHGVTRSRDGHVWLGHRRLSVIDITAAGAQPMTSACGRWMLSFNGEIYNYRELRRELVSVGEPFVSDSDTEVLLRLLQREGSEAIRRLDGMFSFAFYDAELGKLLLARDPFGEKPLYLCEQAGLGFAFASELCALEALPGFCGELNSDAVAELLLLQYIGAPRSIYRNVRKLMPGSYLELTRDGGQRLVRHFRFEPRRVSGGRPSPKQLADELESVLLTSLSRRLIADVPLGAFLSGGLDSATVCALAVRRLGVELRTFSMGFSGSAESEHERAAAIAAHLGTQHSERVLLPHLDEFLSAVPQIMDEPNGDSSCLPTWLLSAFAREQVTVAISGDGGDEMFGGYSRYLAMASRPRSWWARLSSWGKLGQGYYSKRIMVSEEGLVGGLMRGFPQGCRVHLDSLRTQLDRTSLSPVAAMRQSDVDNYLPGAVLQKVDRMSMQHALEVRTPYLSRDLAGFTEGLADNELLVSGIGKRVLRDVARRYLPEELVTAPKRGFALPTDAWGADNLHGVLRRQIDNSNGALRQLFRKSDLLDYANPSRSGVATYRLFPLVTLGTWLDGRAGWKLPNDWPHGRAAN